MEQIDTSEMTGQETDALCAKLRAEKETLRRIGQRLGISPERVRQKILRHERRQRAKDPEFQKMLRWQEINNRAPSTRELHHLLILLPFLKELAQCKS